MLKLSDLIVALQTRSAEWVVEQNLLDQTLVEKVIRALETVAIPNAVPSKIDRETVKSDTVTFDYGSFTVKTYEWTNDQTNEVFDAVYFVFPVGTVVREALSTISHVHSAIQNHLGLETHYQSGNSLKVEIYSGRLSVLLKTRKVQ